MPYKDKNKSAAFMRRKRLDPIFRERSNEISRHAQKKSKLENWLKHACWAAKSRAKARGIEFSILPADLILPEFCPVFGTKLVLGGSVGNPNSPSLDRLNNSRGYVAGNVFVISNRANAIKGDATVDELKAIINYIEQHK